jgi:hypothetical protein
VSGTARPWSWRLRITGVVAVVGLALPTVPALLAQEDPAVARPAGRGEAVEARLRHLRDHLLAHPEARARDAYKLLHQSVFGPAHLIPDRAAAARYLAEEWAAMGATLPGEALLEPLAEEPPLVRVDLRPYRDAGGEPDALVDALVATAATVRGDAELFAACLAGAVAVVGELRGEAEAAALRPLLERGPEGFPPLHHSPEYVAAYHPAYRVVLRSLLPAGVRTPAPAVR